MSLTLNKTLKSTLAVVLVVCMMFVFSGCEVTKNTKNIHDVDQICVSGSYVESWMYIFADAEFVDEVVGIYNSVKYTETDEKVDLISAGEILSFTFSNGSETLAKFIVDSNSIMTFEAGSQNYKIVSEFDFDYLKALVNKQIDKANLPDSTPDEA